MKCEVGYGSDGNNRMLLTLRVFGANVEECVQVEGSWDCGWMVRAIAVVCIFAHAK